eukprot:TRINITY_DN12199_c0_g1_i1.p1 TRINITY_DN12199_c0_g1~~TRINITY_DN12199_c0_g1_i1.p1  ORF type:complete len:239 (-),score=22.78 TRINITY_DN12199_c0_g1_i1:118-834(-)
MCIRDRIMGVCIMILCLWGIVLSKLNLIPYPKTISLGTSKLTLRPCEIYPDFGLHPDKQVLNIWEQNQGLLFGTEPKCEGKYPIKIQGAGICQSEKYTMLINSEGIKINIDCSVGLARALATLYQLCDLNESGLLNINETPIEIEDSPRFSHRGVMIDSSRHFLELKVIRRMIDAMMVAKLNVLHWHLVDDDSFPMESTQIPELAKSGAFSTKMIYNCLLYTSPSPRDLSTSRMPSSA